MLYQLPTGKVIEIPLESYLLMTDEDLEYLIAYNVGEEIENPFYGSRINDKQVLDDIEPDLLNLSSEEKLIDLDLDKEITNLDE